jgi:hypothetical protein
VLTHGAAAPRRERCARSGARSTTKALGSRRTGKPGRSRHHRRRPDRSSCRSARCGAAAVLATRVQREACIHWMSAEQAIGRRFGTDSVVPAAATGGVRDRRRARVKAAPADEAWAVHRWWRREAPAPEAAGRGSHGERESDAGVERAVDGSIEAGRANSPAILPDSPNRANGRGPGQGHSRLIERCSDRVMRANDDATLENGPRARC